MRPLAPRALWPHSLRLVALVLVALFALTGCAKKPRSLAGIGAGGLPPGEMGDPCAQPNTGCACETEGQKVECGSTVSQAGDMITCAKGTRVCQDSKWSECIDTHLEEQTSHRGVFQYRELALGNQALCPNGYDDCDPYCNYQNDTPAGVDAGSKFQTTDAGITLVQTGTGGCNSIAISVRSPTTTTNMVVTGLNPTFVTDQANNKINLQVTASPAGCIAAPFDTTWTIDKFDRAAVSGTKNNDGAVTLALGIAGPIKVTAYAAGHSATTTINVRVNVVEAPQTESTATTSNRKTTTTLMDLFGAGCSTGLATCYTAPTVGTGASTATYLYPYPATWFPLGMVAPVTQWTYSTATGNGQAAKVSLRYPKNQTLTDVIAGTTAFNYSLIIAETNNYRQYADCGSGCAQPLDPQAILPQVAWKAFEQTARSYGDASGVSTDYDADILVQRAKSSVVEQEYRWPTAIHFAGGQLKGTVYYSSYNSIVGGSTGVNPAGNADLKVYGAILKIDPGNAASTPSVAVPGSYQKCTICHSVSADGATLTFESGDAGGTACTGGVLQGSTYRENMCSWTMPGATLKKTYVGSGADPYKFIWGAPYPDGSFYLNNVWDNTRILQYNYPSGSGNGGRVGPGLYRTADAVQLAASGVPAAPVTPAFSSDGSMVAYNLGTLSGNISNPAVVVSENQACGIVKGVKPSEVSACGQPYGLTLSEISSCPGVTLSEISSCGSSAGGVNVSEVEPCGSTPAVDISEIDACTGPTLSEVSACGQVNQLTVSEVSSCPTVELDEIAACGQGSGLTVSEVSSCPEVSFSEVSPCGQASGLVVAEVSSCPDVEVSEVSACQQYAPGGLTISEISACTQFGGGSGDGVQVRNDTGAAINLNGYVIRAGATSASTLCYTFGATTLNPGQSTTANFAACLPNTASTAGLFTSSGAAAAISSHAYTACSTGTPTRSFLPCSGGVWQDGQSTNTDDTSNNSCHPESVEIRNDTPGSVTVTGWTVRNGAGTVCYTLPATTILVGTAAQFSWVGNNTTDCLADGGGTVALYDTSGTPVMRSSHVYPACTAAAPKISTLSATGTWTDGTAGYATVVGNNVSTNYEGVDVRNDSAASIAAGTYTIVNGTCATGTSCGSLTGTILSGTTQHLNTGNCLTDGAGTVSICNGTTTIDSFTYTHACGTTGTQQQHSVLSCGTGLNSAPTWSDAGTAVNSTLFDGTYNTCASAQYEWVEFRNDTPGTMNIGGWEVRNSAGQVCVKVPAGTTLTAGPSAGDLYRTTTDAGVAPDCLSNTGETIYLYDGAGAGATIVDSFIMSSGNCGTTPRRDLFPCNGIWTTSTGVTNDTTNDQCSNYEGIDLRNDSSAGYPIAAGVTVKNGNCSTGTTCATLGASTIAAGGNLHVNTTGGGVYSCLSDGTGTVSVCNGTTTLATYTYAHSCGVTTQRSWLSCGTPTSAPTWSSVNGWQFDTPTANNSCPTALYEWEEIRNNTAATVNIGGWEVRNASNQVCATVPAGTSLTPGASYAVTTGNYPTVADCIPDAGGTLYLYNGTGAGATLVNQRAYLTGNCTTTPRHSELSCTGAWSDAVTGLANDAANNTCTGNYEAVEIRNDTPTAITTPTTTPWTIKAGTCGAGTTCATVTSGVAIAPGTTLKVNTTAGTSLNCLADGSGTVSVCSGTTTVATYNYSQACTGASEQHSWLSCPTAGSAAVWSDGGTAINGTAFDSPTSNNACAAGLYEWAEIRNDSNANPLSIAGWEVRNSAGTVCAIVPAGTTLARGAVYSLQTSTGACFPDTGDTITLYNGSGAGATAMASHLYLTANCGTTPRHSTFSCGGIWNDNLTGAGNDTTNDACTSTEGVEIRNDTSAAVNASTWTIKAGAGCGGTTCGTVGATIPSLGRVFVPTTGCLADTASTVTLCNGATAVTSHAYTACSAGTPTHSVLSCAGAWTDSVAGSANDASNDACTLYYEWVEIRNDTPSTINISGWTVKNNAGTTCVTVPTTTTLASGQVYNAATTTGSCFTDAGDTVKIYDSTGVLQGSRTYTSTCTASTPKRGDLTCGGSWGNDQGGGANDTTNENCTQSAVAEWVEIRNDTNASLNISGWTVRSGATTCVTVPASTTLAAGASWQGYTTTGSCIPDATGTLGIYDASSNLQASRAYTSTCNATTGKRSVLACNGDRTDDVAGAADDTTNDTCTNKEGVDIRNDTPASIAIGGYTVKNGATTCFTVPTGTNLAAGSTYHADTGMCLADGSGTVTLNNGATVVSTHAYNYACSPKQLRSSLSCAGVWTESVAPPASAAFDTTNDTCASQQFEAVEIRNDTPATVDISSWTVRNGATVCGTVPASTTLVAGAAYRLYITSGTCLADPSGTVGVYNSAGVLQNAQAYTASCGQRATLSCAGTWTDSQTGTGDDTTNNSCAGSQSYEWIEIRNDTTSSVNVSGWTVKVAGVLCYTVPASTTLAAGGVYYANTTSGTCMPDAGGTISIYDSVGTLQSSQAYTSTCSAGTPKRGLLPCPAASYVWSNDNTPGTRVTTNDNCSLSGSYDSSGTTLRVKDFSCGATAGSVTCGAATKTFSNERTVVNCADAAQAGHSQCTRPAFPSFLPDNSGVLYQHQIVDSDFEAKTNSMYGALAEIWITKATSKTPVPLDNLNGWNGSNAVTIPTRPRNAALPLPTGTGGVSYDANWHAGTTTTTTYVGNACFPSGASTSVREDELNYYPTVSPQEAGGKYWAIFTSRRLYGNVAVSNPWQVQRACMGGSSCTNAFGTFLSTCGASNAYSPGSGFVETKKLWVSAIDKNWSGSGDPSHPPFYLPGQELKAGNSHGFWASSACTAVGQACETNDDCCGGTGASPINQCKITNTAAVPPTRLCEAITDCSDVGESCATTADCCTGLTCPTGGGVCLSVGGSAYTAAAYQREYTAACPTGTRVTWRNFEWQATIPSGTEIDFAVQTKAKAADVYMPTTAALLGKATATTAAGSWDTANVDDVLKTNNLASLDYLRVTMTFYPDAAAMFAPTLNNWRMIYDCLPAE